MAKILAMFPGQGSQQVGMGRQLLNDFPSARLVFEEAEDAIRVSVRNLCINGPEDELQKTINQQPCILTLSVAIWRVLREEAGLSPHFFAGHSLGEYSALVASGRLDFVHAVRLVRSRGQFMQEAAPAGSGSMAAIIGYDAERLTHLCAGRSEELGLCVEVVNYNSPSQQIISGQRAAVEDVCLLLSEQGIRAVRLPVSAPFHSSLMTPARDAMAPLLSSLDVSEGEGMMIANLTGCIEERYHAGLLTDQINHPVLWAKSVHAAYEAGCRMFAEIGPGTVLTGLARKILPSVSECSLISTGRDIGKAMAALR
ncbi:MAG: ACP S-malonyltransferase [Deltaproteobacteria bacterium]|nr:ACP S-malonyltransferase [Deltaproteobacteria bacterium]